MNKARIFHPFARASAKPSELLMAPAVALNQHIASVPTTYSGRGNSTVAAQPKKQGNYLGIRDVIDGDAHLAGNLTTENSIMVDGTVEGDLTVTGTSRLAIIREGATVRGNVTAPMVLVAGTVSGNIRARSLRLLATAVVAGSIQAERMGVDPGAHFMNTAVRVNPDALATGGGASRQTPSADPASPHVVRRVPQAVPATGSAFAASGTINT